MDGKRRPIHLGKCGKRVAEFVAARVDTILTTPVGMPLDRLTADWLENMPPAMYAKLVAVGLVNAKEPSEECHRLLGPFLDALLARRNDIKESNRTNHQAAMTSLKAFIGESKPLAEVTAGDAEDVRRWLLTKTKNAPQRRLGDNTAGHGNSSAMRSAGSCSTEIHFRKWIGRSRAIQPDNSTPAGRRSTR